MSRKLLFKGDDLYSGATSNLNNTIQFKQLDERGAVSYTFDYDTQCTIYNNISSNAFSSMGSLSAAPFAMAVDGHGNVFAGTIDFTGSLSKLYVQYYGTDEWTLLFTSDQQNGIHAIVIDGNNNIYVGGRFSSITDNNQYGPPVTYNYNTIVKGEFVEGEWIWSPMCDFFLNGNSPIVNALVLDSNILYASGQFDGNHGYGEDVLLNNFARCNINILDHDLHVWECVGNGIAQNGGYSSVEGLTLAIQDIDDTKIIVIGGVFNVVDVDTAAKNIAAYDLTNNVWNTLNGGCPGSGVRSAAFCGNNLYFTGFFTSAGGTLASNVARCTFTTFTTNVFNSLGTGFDSVGDSIAVNGNDIYMVGDFKTVDSTIIANGVCKYDETYESWTAVSTGAPYMKVVCAKDDILYLGGIFSSIARTLASYIAKADTTQFVDIVINDQFATTIVPQEYAIYSYFVANDLLVKSSSGYKDN